MRSWIYFVLVAAISFMAVNTVSSAPVSARDDVVGTGSLNRKVIRGHRRTISVKESKEERMARIEWRFQAVHDRVLKLFETSIRRGQFLTSIFIFAKREEDAFYHWNSGHSLPDINSLEEDFKSLEAMYEPRSYGVTTFTNEEKFKELMNKLKIARRYAFEAQVDSKIREYAVRISQDIEVEIAKWDNQLSVHKELQDKAQEIIEQGVLKAEKLVEEYKEQEKNYFTERLDIEHRAYPLLGNSRKLFETYLRSLGKQGDLSGIYYTASDVKNA